MADDQKAAQTPPPASSAAPPAQDLQKLEKDLAAGGNAPVVNAAKEQAKAVAARSLKKILSLRKSIWSEIPQMFTGVLSQDRPTRKMSILFILSLVGLLSTGTALLHRHWKVKQNRMKKLVERQTRKMTETAKKEAELKSRVASRITLGKFTIELQKVPNQKLAPGVVNMAELEIVVECEDLETRDYVESHLIQMQNQVSNLLTVLNREDLMTREGKGKLKEIILRKLNSWLPQGKLREIYFSNLILS